MPLGGVALQVGVTSMDVSRAFYDSLFGGPPAFVANPDFQEYQPHPGFWFQLNAHAAPGGMKRLRFGVDDIEHVRASLVAAGIDCTPVESIAGLVAWSDFSDPDGNPLGVYQDLAKPQ